jgi:hypothetical protein
MNVIANQSNFRSRFARLALIALMSATVWLGNARAQTTDFAALASTASVPYSLFQYGTLTGSTNTVTATFVPIVTASGTSYQNITLQFDVSASGALTVASLQQTQVTLPFVSSFRAGTYCASPNIGNGKACITVSGPGETSGGTTEWSLTAASGSWADTYPESSTWYVGPLASSPLASRLAAAKITSTDYSYGTVGAQNWVINGTWYYDTLIGLSQIGNTLNILSFTNYYTGLDQNTPVDQITYTLCTTSCPN